MKRILIIRLTALGDVVLVEPVARALAARFPGAAVDLVTEAHHAPIMRAAAVFDTVIPYDRRGADAGWAGMGAVVRRLPVDRYDLVLDLQGKLRTWILSRRIGAGERRVFRKRSFGAAVLSLVGRDPPIDDIHAIDLYLRTVDGLVGQGGPRLHLPPGQAPSTDPRAPDALLIGLGAGTTHATKQWPAERFAALADAIAAARPEARFVLVGGPRDRDTLDTIRSRVASAKLDARDMAALDVEGLGRAIAGLDLFVGVDSGPTHLASALGVPLVAIFGPTSPVRWGPVGGASRAVSLGLDCAPCSNTGGPRCPVRARDHACMRDLGVDQVLAAVQDVLRGAP